MISKETKYGLQALLLLAREYGRGPPADLRPGAAGRIPKKFLGSPCCSSRTPGCCRACKGKGRLLPGETAGRDQRRPRHPRCVLEGPLAPVALRQRDGLPAMYRECHDEATCGIPPDHEGMSRDAVSRDSRQHLAAGRTRRSEQEAKKQQGLSTFRSEGGKSTT